MNTRRETEETGPITQQVWDTRTRENSRWCPYCEHWLRLGFIMQGTLDDKLEYHQREYCSASPTYAPTEP